MSKRLQKAGRESVKRRDARLAPPAELTDIRMMALVIIKLGKTQMHTPNALTHWARTGGMRLCECARTRLCKGETIISCCASIAFTVPPWPRRCPIKEEHKRLASVKKCAITTPKASRQFIILIFMLPECPELDRITNNSAPLTVSPILAHPREHTKGAESV